MVRVQHFARRPRIQPILRRRCPRDVEDPVDVGPDHLVFGRGRRHPLEAIDFPLRDGADGFRQVRGGNPGAKLLDLGLFAFAELVLDRLQLLAEVVLTLRVRHLLLCGRLDLVLHLEQRDLAAQDRGDHLELPGEIVLLEDVLLLVRLHVEEAGQQIRQAQRIVDARHQPAQLLRQAARQRQPAVDQFLQAPHVRVDFERPYDDVGRRHHARPHALAGPGNQLAFRPRQALDDDVNPTGRDLRHLPDGGNGPDGAQVARLGLVFVGGLQREEQEPVAAQRAVDRVDRHRPVDRERLQREGEDDRFTQRDDGQLARIRPFGF